MNYSLANLVLKRTNGKYSLHFFLLITPNDVIRVFVVATAITVFALPITSVDTPTVFSLFVTSQATIPNTVFNALTSVTAIDAFYIRGTFSLAF